MIKGQKSKIYYYDPDVVQKVTENLRNYFEEQKALCNGFNGGIFLRDRVEHYGILQGYLKKWQQRKPLLSIFARVANAVSGTSHKPWAEVSPDFFQPASVIEIKSESAVARTVAEHQAYEYWLNFSILLKEVHRMFGEPSGALDAVRDSVDHTARILYNMEVADPDIRTRELKKHEDYEHLRL